MGDCGVVRCAHCPFKGVLVGAKGPKDSPIVIVGESPGTQEVKQLLPFVGPSGQVLDFALQQHSADSYPAPYYTNAFKCFPGKAKDPATLVQATSSCREQLLAEIKAYPRKVIIALGNAALWALTGNTSLKITQERGKLFPSELAQVGIIAATHPAYLLRGSGSMRQFKADIHYAIHLAKGGEVRGVKEATYQVLEHLDEIHDWAKLYKSWDVPYMGCDIETTGFRHRRDRILMCGITVDGKHTVIVPEKLVKQMNPLFDNFSRQIWHNGKFDVKFLRHVGVSKAFVHEDTMLMSYALEATRGVHDLETMSNDWLGSPNWKAELKKYIPKGGNYGDVPKPILYNYAAKDIGNTFNLHTVVRPLVAADRMSERLYTRTLIPASEYLTSIETNGMRVDTDRVLLNKERLEKEAETYAVVVNEYAKELTGVEINLNSTQQLASLFFDHLKFKPVDARSTSVDVLEKLPRHPVVINMQKYRKVHKSNSTYVKPVFDLIDDDYRIHQTYLLHGTETGRLACRDPNLQNIPRDPMLRGQFVPDPGYVYVEVDLNQAELRSLACLSGDPELIRIYTTAGMSLHDEVRRDIYGNAADWSPQQLQNFMTKFYVETVERVLEEQKMRAKNVNFGIVYGITAHGLAEQIEDTTQEAARMLAAWAKRFRVASEFIEKCRQAPAKGLNLFTVFGHKKRFGVVTPENLRNLQNESANFPHQSTASTITLHGGMRLVYKFLEEYDTRIVNTVHDSIIFEVPKDPQIIRQVTREAVAVLEQVPRDWGITRVPFKADAKAGDRWGSLIGVDKYLKTLEAA